MMKEPALLFNSPESKLSLEYILFLAVFLFFFFLLTPLGLFNDWIPPLTQKGFYSITAIDKGDDAGYYAFMRSAFFDKDLDFFNERNYAHSQKIMPTGYVFNNWQIGQAILYFPFFLIGHLVAKTFNELGVAVSLDGYSFPYYMSTALAAHVYMFAGILILFNLLKNHYSRTIAFISTLGVWLGSSLIYYTFIRQRIAHVPEFFSAILFLSIWLKDRKSNFSNSPILAGILLAFLSTVRLINIGYIFIYLFDWFLFKCRKKMLLNEKIENIKFFLKFFGVFILGFLPQLLIWNKINGVPFPKHIAGMARDSIEDLNFQKYLNRLIDIFFGADWGIVYSMPLMILAVYGLLFLKSFIANSKLGIVIFLTFLLLISIVFPPPDAYGERYLFPAIPLLAFGLANFFKRIWPSKIFRQICLLFTLACFFAQYAMLVQYKTSLKYNNPMFSLSALIEIPSIVLQRKEELLRSTNFVKLLTLKEGSINENNIDLIFMAGFPLIQITLMFVVIIVLGFLKNRSPTKIKTKKLAILITFSVIILIFLIQFLTPLKSHYEIEKRMKYAVYMKRGDSFTKTGKNNLALNLFTKAQRLFPEQLLPYYKKGKLLNSVGQLEKAEKNFRKVFKKTPNHPGTLFYLANIMLNKSNLHQAEYFALKAIRNSPENSIFFDLLGQVYFKSNKFVLAETNYKNAISLKSDSWQAHGNLGILYYFSNKLNQAKFHLQKSIDYGNVYSSISELVKILKDKNNL